VVEGGDAGSVTDVNVDINNDDGNDWLISLIFFAIAQWRGLVLVEEDTLRPRWGRDVV
jgi:hypothetical protein